MNAATTSLVIHEHSLVQDAHTPSKPVRHSHESGELGHLHPEYGPSFYGYAGRSKTTKRLNGLQLPYAERTAEAAYFDVILCDGALVPMIDRSGLRPFTDADMEGAGYLDQFSGYSVVDRMEHGFDLTARFHDWRTAK